MGKTKAVKAPSGAGQASEDANGSGAILLVSALDMSWRLAIAVLVPIIGGYEIDKHLDTSPVFIIVGFLVAMAGTFLIMKQTVAAANSRYRPKEGRK
ncbi:MAG TPA: AtpZ/AtpI family protein [Candidatus Saccharimonadales bacterium]|nr:AtpZ/AtpI family protein [Candidatus Saccharimonadales bacterium]